MKSLDAIKKILKKNKPTLERRFNVKEIGVFGSFVKGENTEESDADILVEFSEPIGLFAFMGMEEYLQELLGVKVDLVSKKALKPHIGKKILDEVIIV
jgi:predicted nucleotidyltransferase